MFQFNTSSGNHLGTDLSVQNIPTLLDFLIVIFCHKDFKEKLNFSPPTDVEGVSLAFNDFLLPQIAQHHKALIPKKLKTSQKTLLPLQLYNLLFASFPMPTASSGGIPPCVFDARPTYLLAAAPALHYGLLYRRSR